VRINDTLTLLFDDVEEFESHHYAFHVGDAEFDAIFGRIREAKLAYGSAPSRPPRFAAKKFAAKQAPAPRANQGGN
jgi:hypothetical protein